ncbi:MAG: sodium/solute symporter, partial [Candidatus Humimicrobiaceae bacterium]
MNYQASPLAIIIFLTLVAIVLGISYYFARKARSADGYFAAGGSIHWSVNGIAFAGDYLSAASFLGICGMIAFSGYDGFLYSIGYLAGWIVALFVVAEPLKRLGKYTFTDALDAKFNSKGIKLMASISTIIVSMFYLIPQMVGAGSLVTPLLGLPHWAGVLMVGTVVIVIVATAGMTSTTYVQFIKGGLLLLFSFALVVSLLVRGISTQPDQGGQVPFKDIKTIEVVSASQNNISINDNSYVVKHVWNIDVKGKTLTFVKLEKDGIETMWKLDHDNKYLEETLSVTRNNDGTMLYNGAKKEDERFYQVGNILEINGEKNVRTGSLNPLSFISTIKNSTVIRWNKTVIADESSKITVYYPNPTSGSDILSPGLYFKVDPGKGATPASRLDFVSLMIALFFGTAALPHILIRYYTVSSPTAARKSTIVAIASIGLFYVLTLYMGLGAMVSGVLDLNNDNMSAPLLARSFGVFFFAIITAIAFATILGTVSGLIVASSGAVAHDFMDRF